MKDPTTAGLDDRLSVHVQNFGTLLKQANDNCIIPPHQFFAFLLILAVSLAIFIHLCRRTSLIRTGTNLVPRDRPYSLALFQMSFWFFLVIAAYVSCG